LVALIGAAFTHAAARAADAQCAEPRKRSEGVEQIAYGLIEDQVLFQGYVLHAEDTGEGRPVPEMNPIDYKRAWVKFLLPVIEWSDPNALFFTFHNLDQPSADPEVINVPFDTYWCVAAMGDLVLLSDGVRQHHYSNVASIDRDNQTITLIDRWPDILSEFAGVVPEAFAAPPGSGRITGRKLVRFSRTGFKRLFVAALTVDTAEFVKLLKRTIPRDAWTPETDIALGRALLYAGERKSFAPLAADFIIDGVRGAGRTGKQDTVKRTVPVMFTAVALAHAALVAAGNQERAEAARKYRDAIEARYGTTAAERIGVDDALRIARASSGINDPETALYFLGEAIRKDSTDYRAFLFRAVLREDALKGKVVPGSPNRDEILGAVGDAQADAEYALKLMDAREREFEQRRQDRAQKRGVYWVKGITAEQVDGAERDELRLRRNEARALADRLDLLRGLIGSAAPPAPPKP
jgi:hypothetical protein